MILRMCELQTVRGERDKGESSCIHRTDQPINMDRLINHLQDFGIMEVQVLK